SDDFGLVGLKLRLRIENGPALQPKPYRKGESLRRGDGSYPQVLAYRDFVELSKLQKVGNQPLEPLRPGTQIEYWLEATDNCDYPGPNIGESKHFKVTIQRADPDQKKQDQQRREAQQEQQKHENKQDQDLQQQKKEPRDNPQEQNSRPQNDAQPGNSKEQQDEQALTKQKEKIENAIKEHEQQQQGTGQGEAKKDPSQAPKGENK